MWNRAELKARGKFAFRANYWRCVLVALILIALVGGSGTAAANSTSNTVQEQGGGISDMFSGMSPTEQGIIAAAVLGTIGVISIVSLILAIFVFNPLEVGGQRFFIVNSKEPAELGELGFGFKNYYGNVVKVMFLRALYTFLWSLLFVIPGIIKSYSYMMVPYILAENPTLSPSEAIGISRKMMNGNKWRAFVFDLSFILWDFAAALTLGILGVFYVNPYKFASKAELYYAIKAQAGY